MPMQVILTHEQADFDALGSLLGAYLLNEQAVPVLPRRLNRNVRSFLTLYGDHLPFIEARDLPVTTIDAAYLVDTQSMITLKGMNRQTRVNVADHHHKRDGLPDKWNLNIDSTGACTTLFVEDLRENHESLSVIHATLMLLGIYEDTGALTYASTTPRDLIAAAYLLEQGASLRVTTEYLNPPLSDDQRQLYEKLLSSAQYHTIHNQRIVVACADGQNLEEEISSIAHKLRDLLDLEALFLIVNTSEGLRLVARSTTNRINVSDIAAHFGGGGHERAAAALIHPERVPRSLEKSHPYQSVCDELLRILPEHVQPSITVAQIMSRQPMLLSPNTSANEAMQLMQRFGYEGYPVVKDDQVIGLLTRRTVDRALSHKLDLPASSLMEAGGIFVHPEDSLERLQQVMAESGWGQIPVVERESGKIIAIVTRTDLLDTLTNGKVRHPGRLNMAAKIREALPPARLALLKAVAEQASIHHLGVYIVGGFVRDLLLDCPSLDFDIVVEGDALRLGKALVTHFGGRIVSHKRFGTAKWWIADIHNKLAFQLNIKDDEDVSNLPASLDLISARTEFYEYPSALPTVRSSSIKLDLHRRDFTINTMALRLDGKHFGDLYDYWGGMSDLKNNCVRVLHSISFVDDPTRLLRAVRFEQRFNFRIEARTQKLMDEARLLLRQVSGERIQHEFNLILSETKPTAILSRLHELGLLQAIHPDLVWSDDLNVVMRHVLMEELDPEWKLPSQTAGVPIRKALGYILWFCRFPVDTAHSIASRLRLRSQLQEALHKACILWLEHSKLTAMKPSEACTFLEGVSLASLYAVWLLIPSQETRQIIHQYIKKWRYIQPNTTGDVLRSLKIPTGPNYRYLLESLRAAWLDNIITSEKEENELLHSLITSLVDTQ